jgi:dihydrofolate reductase
MTKVIATISMSLDGFIAGPDINRENPLGTNGPRLHDWLFAKKTSVDESIARDITDGSGAVIVGWRTYIDAIDTVWESENPFSMPAVVQCRALPQTENVESKGFTFVPGDMTQLVQVARGLAGDKNIWVMGGARAVQQVLRSKLADELIIHLVPILLGSGLRLFGDIVTEATELSVLDVTQSPAATHLRYRILKDR